MPPQPAALACTWPPCSLCPASPPLPCACRRCWAHKPSDRPSFERVAGELRCGAARMQHGTCSCHLSVITEWNREGHANVSTNVPRQPAAAPAATMSSLLCILMLSKLRACACLISFWTSQWVCLLQQLQEPASEERAPPSAPSVSAGRCLSRQVAPHSWCPLPAGRPLLCPAAAPPPPASTPPERPIGRTCHGMHHPLFENHMVRKQNAEWRRTALQGVPCHGIAADSSVQPTY